MDVGTESPLSNFVDHTCLEGLVNMLEGRTAIQKDHDKLEKKIDKSLINCNKGKCKVLPQGWNNPMQQYRLEAVGENQKSTWGS